MGIGAFISFAWVASAVAHEPLRGDNLSRLQHTTCAAAQRVTTATPSCFAHFFLPRQQLRSYRSVVMLDSPALEFFRKGNAGEKVLSHHINAARAGSCCVRTPRAFR